jgi:vacuolar-type H+-ATPase subunit H
LPSNRFVAKKEPQRQKFQVVGLAQVARELATKEKVRQDAAAESAKFISNAQQKAEQIMREAEQTAAELTDKAKAEADAKSATIVADAQQKAALIMREAEQTARKLTSKEKVRKDAEIESATIITDAQQKAEQIMREAEQTAKELIDKAKIEAGAEWVKIVNQATEIANRLKRLDNLGNQAEPKSKGKQGKTL